eukprot:scaffold21_cov368-Prasinococcus_capsulatus_cf.AAC.28
MYPGVWRRRLGIWQYVAHGARPRIYILLKREPGSNSFRVSGAFHGSSSRKLPPSIRCSPGKNQRLLSNAPPGCPRKAEEGGHGLASRKIAAPLSDWIVWRLLREDQEAFEPILPRQLEHRVLTGDQGTCDCQGVVACALRRQARTSGRLGTLSADKARAYWQGFYDVRAMDYAPVSTLASPARRPAQAQGGCAYIVENEATPSRAARPWRSRAHAPPPAWATGRPHRACKRRFMARARPREHWPCPLQVRRCSRGRHESQPRSNAHAALPARPLLLRRVRSASVDTGGVLSAVARRARRL